ncbi:MAG: ATP-binding protein [Rubrivivax sp.]|nr:ATP-binding protein [Rubrivivax sp.]
MPPELTPDTFAAVSGLDSEAPLRLELPAALAAVETARRAVLGHLRAQALSARTIYRVELVLEEVLMNIIRHAFPHAGEHRIHLQVCADSDQIRLRFEDEGVEFDPSSAAARPAPASLDEAQPGGLGLVLVRRHARQLAYARRDGRNVLDIAVARS